MRGNKNGLWSYTVALSPNEVEFFPHKPAKRNIPGRNPKYGLAEICK